MNLNFVLTSGKTLLDRLREGAEMSTTEQILAGLQVVVLGVAIVFVALILLFFAIQIMNKVMFSSKKETKPAKTQASSEPKENSSEQEETKESDVDNKELVAVISAAIASSINTSTHNIVVTNIKRVEGSTPAWAKAGRSEQIYKGF